jgi:hypothetical protein
VLVQIKLPFVVAGNYAEIAIEGRRPHRIVARRGRGGSVGQINSHRITVLVAYLAERKNKDLRIRLTLLCSICLRAVPRPSPVQSAMVVVDNWSFFGYMIRAGNKVPDEKK